MSGEQASEDDADVESDHSLTKLEQVENAPNAKILHVTFPEAKTDRIAFEDVDLPSTCTVLRSPSTGSRVILVGCAHFSLESQEEVAKVIRQVEPDFLFLELCQSRSSLLKVNEEQLLAAGDISLWDHVSNAIREHGFYQGVGRGLLFGMSAHCIKQLGMAPGGEMRRAVKEVEIISEKYTTKFKMWIHTDAKFRFTDIILGDRPFDVTMNRVFAALPLWERLKIFVRMIFEMKTEFSKEDVEKLKERDVFEEFVLEMAKEFPAATKVLLDERDQYMAAILQHYSNYLVRSPSGIEPAVIVAVIGIGHSNGIAKYWDKKIDARELLIVPQPSLTSRVISISFKVAVLGATGYCLYRSGRFIVGKLYSMVDK